MKQILLFFITGLLFTACGKDNFHDSGVANGKLNCSIWDYMQMYPDTWDSVTLMIEKANLRDIFDGTNPDYPQITFFGPVNYSVARFLLKTTDEEGNRLYHSIGDVPPEICRQMVLSHLLPRRMLKEEFDYEVKGTETGGSILKTLTGIDLRVYRIKTPYYDIPDLGPEYLAIHALEKGYKVNVSSVNIETTNGVVHSLSNTYEMVEL